VPETDVVTAVLRAYGITEATVTPLDIHGTTSVARVVTGQGPEMMLKRTSAIDGTELRLVEQAELTRQLFERGVRVAVPMVALDGQPVVHMDDAVFTLTSRLTVRAPGLPDRAEVWSSVGGQLATLHTALEQCAARAHGWTMDLPRQLEEEIWPTLDAVADVIGPLLPAVADRVELANRVAGLPQQRLHGDTHGGNILLDRLGVYGIVDFDEIPIGPRVNDVGYYAADLVKNRNDLPGGVVEIIGNVVAGYHRAAVLSQREVDALVPLMIVTELRFLWWFRTSDDNLAQFDNHLDTLGWILAHRAELDAVVGLATTGSAGGG
jgi:Ser/Thr protein kinase RdoA (MazF antagonist)